jgi:hypothetical protein
LESTTPTGPVPSTATWWPPPASTSCAEPGWTQPSSATGRAAMVVGGADDRAAFWPAQPLSTRTAAHSTIAVGRLSSHPHDACHADPPAQHARTRQDSSTAGCQPSGRQCPQERPIELKSESSASRCRRRLPTSQCQRLAGVDVPLLHPPPDHGVVHRTNGGRIATLPGPWGERGFARRESGRAVASARRRRQPPRSQRSGRPRTA